MKVDIFYIITCPSVCKVSYLTASVSDWWQRIYSTLSPVVLCVGCLILQPVCLTRDSGYILHYHLSFCVYIVLFYTQCVWLVTVDIFYIINCPSVCRVFHLTPCMSDWWQRVYSTYSPGRLAQTIVAWYCGYRKENGRERKREEKRGRERMREEDIEKERTRETN